MPSGHVPLIVHYSLSIKKMNTLKKYAGVVWIALGLYVGYDRVLDSITKIGSEKLEDRVFGWVVLLVLVPIIVGGLVTFGRYALAENTMRRDTIRVRLIKQKPPDCGVDGSLTRMRFGTPAGEHIQVFLWLYANSPIQITPRLDHHYRRRRGRFGHFLHRPPGNETR